MHLNRVSYLLATTTLAVGVGAGYGIDAATSGASAPAAASSGSTSGGATGGARPENGFGGNGGFGTSGKIASVTGDTLEVQGTSGETTVKISSSTTISKTTTEKLSSSSLTTGLCVRAVGATASNGTVSASSLILTPASSSGTCTATGGFPGRSGSGSTSSSNRG